MNELLSEMQMEEGDYGELFAFSPKFEVRAKRSQNAFVFALCTVQLASSCKQSEVKIPVVAFAFALPPISSKQSQKN